MKRLLRWWLGTANGRLLLLALVLTGAWAGAYPATPPLRPLATWTFPEDDAKNVSLSQDGSTLILSGAIVGSAGGFRTSDWSTPVRLLDAVTGRERLRIQDQKVRLSDLRFAPDSSWLLLQDSLGGLTLWDAATGRQRAVLRPPAETRDARQFGRIDEFGGLAASPDGRLIASQRPEGGVQLWASATGQPAVTLANAYWPFMFTPDGSGIVTGTARTEAKLWDTATGRERFSFPCHHSPIGAAFVSQDGRRIATGLHGVLVSNRTAPTNVKLWDAHTGAEVTTVDLPHPPDAIRLGLSSNGTILAIYADAGPGRLWNVSGPEPVCRDEWIGDRSLSPNLLGFTLAFGPSGRIVLADKGDRTLTVASSPDGTPRAKLRLLGSAFVREYRFADDGRSFVVSYPLNDVTLDSWVVQVFDLETGQERAFLPRSDWRSIVGLSPDGHSLWTMRLRLATPQKDPARQNDGVKIIERWEIPPPGPSGPPAWLLAVTALGVLLAAADRWRPRRVTA